MQEDYYMMWLSRIDGLTKQKAEILLNYFNSPKEVWYAPKEFLMQVKGIDKNCAEKICNAKNEETVENWIYELEEKEIQYISRYSTKFPYLLRQIYSPPLGLYVKGDLPDDSMDKISIVGARKCSPYGKKCANKIAKRLAECNLVVVSGMAQGIDTAAHKGSLEALGPTIAVLGCGLDVCFPTGNKELMEHISSYGCLISEYPLSTPPLAYHFPQRNRIIAGLSKATVVIEAGIKSGSLITADIAIEEGRDVFVVPGEITSPYSAGTNELIKNGAGIITNVDDILSELGIEYSAEQKKEYREKYKAPLAPDEKRVYDCISLTPVDLDYLIQKLGGSIQELQSVLTILEINGLIQKLPAERYIRT